MLWPIVNSAYVLPNPRSNRAAIRRCMTPTKNAASRGV